MYPGSVGDGEYVFTLLTLHRTALYTPQLAPAHERSDDCVPEKTEEADVSAAISAEHGAQVTVVT
jgi:hypothetical protein